MKLDLTSMRDSLSALEKSLAFLHSDMAKDAALREQFRNSAIQCFEFTHEVAFKMLKRQLERMAADPAGIDAMTYMEIIRSGAEAGLLHNVARFKIYREKRNITSHTYDRNKAEEIVSVLGEFRNDIRDLLAELEKRNLAAD